MKTKLVQIGKSKGVRLPKGFIKKAGINGSVEIMLRGNEIVLRSKPPRDAWDKEFERAIREHGPVPDLTKDDLAFLGVSNDFDEKEWTW